MTKTICSIALVAYLALARAFAADPLQAFPAAEAGMVRHVINLAKQDDESLLRVELIVGKTVKTDAANRYFFAGTLETESLPGWGYERYILRQLGPMAGTLMAVAPAAPQVERFIALGGEPRLLLYNSRLPLVAYVPAGVEVRHRLWRAESPGPLRKLALPGGLTAVVSEGALEARSTGSYAIRIYSVPGASPDDDTTFFSSELIRPRDGSIERIFLAALKDGDPPCLVVAIRSAGTGGYLSADAFRFTKGSISLQASASGLPADTDLTQALKRTIDRPAPRTRDDIDAR